MPPPKDKQPVFPGAQTLCPRESRQHQKKENDT